MLLLLAFALPLYSIATGVNSTTAGVNSTTAGVDVSSPTSIAADLTCSGNWPPKEREVILKVHNELRKRLREGTFVAGNGKTVPFFKKAAAKPGTMPDLKYNCTIEDWAQKYADICASDHGQGGPDVTPPFPMGENLAWLGGNPKDPTNFTGFGISVQLWENEFYHSPWICNLMKHELWENKGPHAKLGHASQMIWADTTEIGCGIKNCGSGNFVVCRYFPPGNVRDMNMYEPADGVQPPCEYPGLPAHSSIQLSLPCLLAVALLSNLFSDSMATIHILRI